MNILDRVSQSRQLMDENKLTDEIKAEFAKETVVVHAYNYVYEFVKTLSETVMIDPKKINYSIFNNIPANVEKVEKDNPAILFKAIKNEVELSNIRKSHMKTVLHLPNLCTG